MAKQVPKETVELLEEFARYELDPLGFTEFAFPWGEAGTPLENHKGLYRWQKEFLGELGERLVFNEKKPKPASKIINMAISSGHGVGKTAIECIIAHWATSTMEDSRVRITADTEAQLMGVTWAEMQKWYNMFIGKDLFEMTATKMHTIEPGRERNWLLETIAWSVNNPAAFAGLHNQGKRIATIFDEASEIHDDIFEVVDGITDVDTQIIRLCFGNPTRNTGRFYDCFYSPLHKASWFTMNIDSRTVENANMERLNQFLENECGGNEESNTFRIRVRGLPPTGSDSQFIGLDLVEKAVNVVIREEQIKSEPKIIGIDPSWTGGDAFVVYLRQGLYSKLLASWAKNDNDMEAAGKIAALEDEYAADAVFIDRGAGTGVYSGGQYFGRNWQLVDFNGKPTNELYLNKRMEMWAGMKKWLQDGGQLPFDDKIIQSELIAPECFTNQRSKWQLESKESMKKRGIKSPNNADALALTFAYPVIPKNQQRVFGNGQTARKPYNPIHNITDNWRKNNYGLRRGYNEFV